MITVQKILCPTDLSEHSERAFAHAIALAKWFRAEVTALMVVPTVLPAPMPLPMAVVPEPPGRALHKEVETSLREFVLPAEAARVPVKRLVRDGDPVEVILETAKEIGADLIVIGTHGSRGFERWVLGSVTEKVLRRATCPVLTVPRADANAAGEGFFKPILCPVDFSESSLKALDYALSLARETHAPLILLHTVDPELVDDPRALMHFNMPEYRSFLEIDGREKLQATVSAEDRKTLEIDDVVAAGKPFREILRLAKERDAGWIVMGVRGRGAVDLLLFGSTTHHVVREATCPVLTICTPAETKRSSGPGGRGPDSGQRLQVGDAGETGRVIRTRSAHPLRADPPRAA